MEYQIVYSHLQYDEIRPDLIDRGDVLTETNDELELKLEYKNPIGSGRSDDDSHSPPLVKK
jgi:hypothetical protein